MKYIDACENGAWTLEFLNRKTLRRWCVGFKCHSWRHDGECRRWKNAQDFVRIKGAIEKIGEEWVYVVLTFDRKSWDSIWKAYRGLLLCWARLRKRFVYSWGEVKYIALVEQHRDGWPHLNLLLYNRKLYEACQDDGWKQVRQGWLEPNAVECGFGFRTWIEPVRSEEAIAGYFVKLCGEIAKVDQVPVEAPAHFRRIRASKGLLPSVYHNLEVTGRLIMESLEVVLARIERLEKCRIGNCLVKR